MNDAESLYKSGLTLHQVGVKIGMSASSVMKLLKSLGVERRSQGLALKTTVGDRNSIVKMVESGSAISEAANRFHVSWQYVSQLCQAAVVVPKFRKLKRKLNELKIKTKMEIAERRYKSRSEMWRRVVDAVCNKASNEEIINILAPIYRGKSLASILVGARSRGIPIPLRTYLLGKYPRKKGERKPPDPVKKKARAKLNTEIRAKRITRRPCEVCGNPNSGNNILASQ